MSRKLLSESPHYASPRELAELVWLEERWLPCGKIEEDSDTTQLRSPEAEVDHQSDPSAPDELPKEQRAQPRESRSYDAEGALSGESSDEVSGVETPQREADPPVTRQPFRELDRTRLTTPLLFARAFHRLAPKRAISGHYEIDIGASVKKSAVYHRPQLVLRELEEQSTHLIFLWDGAAQLVPWRRQLKQLKELLSMFGSFTSITSLHLEMSSADTLRCREDDGRYIDAAAENVLQEQLRPGYDNLVMLISDGIGRSVTSGRLGYLLASLQGAARVVWVHPWPKSRWRESRLYSCRRRKKSRNGVTYTAVPVVELTPQGLQLLAPWVRGRDEQQLALYHLPTLEPKSIRHQPVKVAQVSHERDWELHTRRFRDATDPISQQLLGLAASTLGKISLGTLRWIADQIDELTPESFHLSQVMTSGFLRRVEEWSEDPVLEFIDERARVAVLDGLLLRQDHMISLLEALVRRYFPSDGSTGALSSEAEHYGIHLNLLLRVFDHERYESLPESQKSSLESYQQSSQWHTLKSLEILPASLLREVSREASKEVSKEVSEPTVDSSKERLEELDASEDQPDLEHTQVELKVTQLDPELKTWIKERADSGFGLIEFYHSQIVSFQYRGANSHVFTQILRIAFKSLYQEMYAYGLSMNQFSELVDQGETFSFRLFRQQVERHKALNTFRFAPLISFFDEPHSDELSNLEFMYQLIDRVGSPFHSQETETNKYEHLAISFGDITVRLLTLCRNHGYASAPLRLTHFEVVNHTHIMFSGELDGKSSEDGEPIKYTGQHWLLKDSPLASICPACHNEMKPDSCSLCGGVGKAIVYPKALLKKILWAVDYSDGINILYPLEWSRRDLYADYVEFESTLILMSEQGLSEESALLELTYLFILRFQEELEITDQLAPHCSWDDLNVQRQKSILNRYNTILARLGRNSNVIFREIFQYGFTAINSDSNLKVIVESLSLPDLNEMTREDILNLYDYICSQGGVSDQLVKAIIEVMDPQPDEVISDPAVGDGQFLFATAQRFATDPNYPDKFKGKLYGVELSNHIRLCTLFKAYINKVPCEIQLGDTLEIGARLPKSDVIFCNPPFVRLSLEPSRDDLSIKTDDGLLCFMQHIWGNLREGGRAAVLVPDSFLSKSGETAQVREALLSHCELHTMLRLPKFGLGIHNRSLHVLFFRKRVTPSTNLNNSIKLYSFRDQRETDLSLFVSFFGYPKTGSGIKSLGKDHHGRVRFIEPQEVQRRDGQLLIPVLNPWSIETESLKAFVMDHGLKTKGVEWDLDWRFLSEIGKVKVTQYRGEQDCIYIDQSDELTLIEKKSDVTQRMCYRIKIEDPDVLAYVKSYLQSPHAASQYKALKDDLLCDQKSLLKNLEVPFE